MWKILKAASGQELIDAVNEGRFDDVRFISETMAFVHELPELAPQGKSSSVEINSRGEKKITDRVFGADGSEQKTETYVDKLDVPISKEDFEKPHVKLADERK